MVCQQADRVGVRRDDVVCADVDCLRDATQRLSVAVQYSAAQEVAEALAVPHAARNLESRLST